MQKQESQKIKQAWVRLKETLGMTMVEILVVVAIISILGGVTGVAVWRYRRSLAQLERDGIAKEIFVAAQNHLTAAKGEGYLGKSGYGRLGTTDADIAEGKSLKVYYFTVDGGQSADGQDAFKLMLPFGSIDETVRTGGHYIIRYQPDTATVLDVFYWSKTGSPSVFNYHSDKENGYETVIELRDDNNKAARRTFAAGGNSVLGWYGGADATKLPTLTLLPPAITVTNGDQLFVTVTDSNSGNNNAMLQLIIKGVKSDAKKTISLDTNHPGWDNLLKTYTVVLDDITDSGKHFCELTADTGTFIPGEDITVQAVAYSTSVLANIATSDAKMTNSLFADGTTTTQALISSVRHLENLDKKVSNLDAHDTDENLIQISSAVQINDLDWAPYFSDKSVRYSAENGPAYQAVHGTSSGYYYPINPDYSLTYNGNNHRISNVTASGTNAGLFGSVTTVSSISNLELLDFTITGTTSAGALAGTLTNCDVTNVLARNRPGLPATNSTAITATGTAGGLIGKLDGGSVSYSAAAMVVNGSTNAGGLIGEYTNAGNSVDTKEIKGCYSGGHTSNGSYKLWVEAHQYDVIGATAGGLIGSAGSATISSSYSTCSVSGTTAAGGFVGSAGGSISDCYAAGLVNKSFITDATPNPNSSKGAFAGSFEGSAINCVYYGVINDVRKGDETESTLDHYLGAVGDANKDGITRFDFNADTYNTFVGNVSDWAPATAYDTPLMHHYGGKYNLRAVLRREWEKVDNVSDLIKPKIDNTGLIHPEKDSNGVDQYDTLTTTINNYFVSTHYGDWPSPEVFFENTPKPQTP